MAKLIAKSKYAKYDLFESAEPGDVFFSKSRSVISWLVRKTTGFDRSHTFTKVNNRTILDSDFGGIKIRCVKTYLDDPMTIIELVKLPKCINRKVFLDALTSKVGSFYDYGLMLGGVISRLLKITRWRNMLFQGASRYTCSEYISECLKLAGAEFKLHTSQITPKDLYYYLTRCSSERISLESVTQDTKADHQRSY